MLGEASHGGEPSRDTGQRRKQQAAREGTAALPAPGHLLPPRLSQAQPEQAAGPCWARRILLFSSAQRQDAEGAETSHLSHSAWLQQPALSEITEPGLRFW